MRTEVVLISVTGEQTHPDGTKEKNTVQSRADHEIMEDGTHRFVYEENVDDVGGKVMCEIRVNDRRITVEKAGQYGSRMIFEAGEERDFTYRTPYGELPMHTRTEHVACLVVNGNLHAQAKYRLEMAEGYDVESKVIIKTEPVSR